MSITKMRGSVYVLFAFEICSLPVPVPELFGKYLTRPVPKSKTPTCRTLPSTHKRPFWNIHMAAIYEKCQNRSKFRENNGRFLPLSMNGKLWVRKMFCTHI